MEWAAFKVLSWLGREWGLLVGTEEFWILLGIGWGRGSAILGEKEWKEEREGSQPDGTKVGEVTGGRCSGTEWPWHFKNKAALVAPLPKL